MRPVPQVAAGPWRQALHALRAWALGALLAMSFPGLASAEGVWYPLLEHGPASNRVNLAVLSEGYTSAQVGRFLDDATNAVRSLLSVEPYAEYQTCFNARALFVPSAQSGSDHPSQNYYRDTYFNSTFDSSGISSFLTIPPNSADADYDHGQGKIDRLLAPIAPRPDLVLLLVNDLAYGGGGGNVLISSASVSSPMIVVHESGHTLAGLGDEYADPYPGFPDLEEPNTTRETRREFLKWRAWVDVATPLPTPTEADYADRVGLFEGAHYQSLGWYRPKLDCGMRHLGVPFCEVCREAIVLAILKRVALVDSSSPPSSEVAATAVGATRFSMALVPFRGHAAEIQWFTNGVAVEGAVSDSLELSAPTGGRAIEVQAAVKDPTPWVRNDPDDFARRSRSWLFSPAPTPLRLQSLPSTSSPAPRFSFLALGDGSVRFAVERSVDLRQWEPIRTNELSEGRAVIDIDIDPASGRQFFRGRQLP